MKSKNIFPTLEFPFSSILRRKYLVLPYLTTFAFWQTTLVVNNRNEHFLRA